jgi:UTP--glucose-1-phosphate uridylyltransferase
MAPVTKVIVPCLAGSLGWLPASTGHPGESPRAGGRPAVQDFFAEMERAGLTHVVFVTGWNKPTGPGFRDRGAELVSLLAGPAGSGGVLFGAGQSRINFSCLRQRELRGLADAVLAARYVVAGEDFAVVSGGTIIEDDGGEGFLARLIRCHRANAAAATLAVDSPSEEDAPVHGFLTPGAGNGSFSQVADIVEDCSPGDASSALALAGRYVLSPEIFNVIESMPARPDGEVHLSDCFRELIDEEAPVYCVKLPPGAKPRRSPDLGNFLSALLDFAFAGPGSGSVPSES